MTFAGKPLLLTGAVVVLFLTLGLGCGDSAAAGARADDARPNVVLLVSDDQALGTLGVEGHPWSRTPRLDRLAERGTRFSHAFVTTALCSPSRASILTGRYARSHGVLDNETVLPLGTTTFASRMTEAGYDSAYIGKWHMGEEPGLRPGFRWSATIAGQGSYRVNEFRIGDEQGFEDKRVLGSIDEASTTFAVDFIRRRREAPFLLVVGFKGPHRPHRPSIPLEGLYPDVEIVRPANAEAYPPFPMHHELEELSTATGVPTSELVVPEDWANAGAGRRPEEWSGREVEPAERVRDYFRVIHGLDQSVGRIVEALRVQGVLENTLVVYTSDNGMGMGSHGMIGKHTCYEESVRVPLIVSFPGRVSPGVLRDELVLNVDLAPTLLDFVGLPFDEGFQGRSLRVLLEGEPEPQWRSEILLEVVNQDSPLPSSKALRSRDWKLIQYPDRASWTELFAIADDPGERLNLARDPAHAAQLAEMLARLEAAERALDPARD